VQRHFFVIIGIVSFLFAAGLRPTAAQSATATLSGTVVDEQGAVVPGANVTLADAGRAVERQATTNSEGYFIVTQLPPSACTVSVERNGFATARRRVPQCRSRIRDVELPPVLLPPDGISSLTGATL